MAQQELGHLPTFDKDSKLVNIVVETSKGMRTKLKYEEDEGVFRAEEVPRAGSARAGARAGDREERHKVGKAERQAEEVTRRGHDA